MLRWLFLDLNSYFASCEQQENPQLRGKPVGVVPMLVDSTCCIAASKEAKKFGVKTGTLVGDAKRMCPGMQFVQAHHSRYVDYHKKIIAVIESIIPIAEVCSIDEVACELTGSQCQEEKARALAHKLKEEIKKQVGECLTVSIGIAPNKLLAKLGTDMQKPDGLVVIHKEELPQRLHPLKLRDFCGIGSRMEKRLNNKGVFTVEGLYLLPKREMKLIWGGIGGERFYELIRGENISLPASRTRSMGHQHVLPPEYRSYSAAFTILQELTLRAAERLRREEMSARHLWVFARFVRPYDSSKPYDPQAPRPKRKKWTADMSFHPTQSSFLFLDVLKRLYDEAPRTETPFMVGVVLSHLEKSTFQESTEQLNAFSNPGENTLMKTIDKINGKYGRGTLFFGCQQGREKKSTARIAFSRVPDEEEF